MFIRCSITLCLGNISKDFITSNMKKTGLKSYVYDFSVDYNIIDNSNNINIHKYLMKNHNIKCLYLLKNLYWFISWHNASDNTKFIPLSNQQCMTQPTLINLHTN